MKAGGSELLDPSFEQYLRPRFLEEVLDLYLFDALDQLREITDQWLIRYNESWPHDALGNLSPLDYAKNAGISTFEVST